MATSLLYPLRPVLKVEFRDVLLWVWLNEIWTSWPQLSVYSFVAQLVEHYRANTEAKGLNPVEAPRLFSMLIYKLFSQLRQSYLYCDRAEQTVAVHRICCIHCRLISYENSNHTQYFSKGFLIVFKTLTKDKAASSNNKYLCLNMMLYFYFMF